MKKGRELAEGYGYKVRYFVGGNIRYAGGEFRGVVDTANKTVMVRADHPDYTAEQIMRHEMGHAAFENGDLSIDEAREMLLDDFTADELNELIEIYNNAYGGILSAEEAFEEICCDALGRMNVFEGTDLNSESYGKAQDTVRKYAAERSGSKGRAPPKKGGEKYSKEQQNQKDRTVEAVKSIQSMSRKSINDFTSAEIAKTRPFAEKYWREMGTKSPFFRAWFGDWRSNDKTAAAVVNVGGGSFKAGKAINKDTGTALSWGDVLKKETIVHQSSGGVASRALGAIENIVENAILLDTYTSSLSSKTKMPGTAFMHSYYTVVNYEGTDYLLKLFAEEAVSLKNGEIFTRAYELKDIKKVAVLPNGVLSKTGGLTDGNTSTTLTIADIAALVKKYDKSYNPKPTSKVVNEDGTPMVVYHGTDDTFWKFDTNKISDREGSFFFAQNREDAEAYSGSGHIMEAYVNLQNPIDYNEMPSEIYKLKDKKAQVEALKRMGYDGWLADMDTGWGEISAFYPEQVKSATDNIGTFDSSSPDIRYSREPERLNELRRQNEELKQRESTALSFISVPAQGL